MYYRVIEGQAERMDRMENAMRKVKVREEQLETELEQLNRVLEEQYRQKAKDHYEGERAQEEARNGFIK